MKGDGKDLPRTGGGAEPGAGILAAEAAPRLVKVFADLIDVMDIAMWELDLEYRVVAYNRKARQIYGEKALGDYCYHAAAGLSRVCEDCPAEQVYAGRASGRSEHKRRDASGKAIHIDHIATPIRNAEGRLTGVLLVIIDITRHKEMEAELLAHRDRLEEMVAERTEALSRSESRYRSLYEESKRREELYRSLLSSSTDAIVIYDLSGKPVYISPSFTQMFGWTFEELAGRRIPFVPEAERDASMAHIRALFEEGTPCREFETRRLTKDGRVLDISLSASRYHDHQGEPAGMLVILRDISDRKRLQDQLRHAERMEAIGTLAGGIAHDFNNIMMGIMGNASLMLSEIDPSHPHHDPLKKVENLIHSGSRLTAQLLGYARKGRYAVRPVSLNRVVGDTAETFARTRRQVSLRTDLAEGLFPVEADEHQMEQMLLNLFINAADAMPGGGRLTVKTRNAPARRFAEDAGSRDYAVVQVGDTGRGIEADVIDKIFDPFFTTKEIGGGTGLGLASVYGIVKGHGGHVEVNSEVGSGTTFTVYLPATRREARPAPASEPDSLRADRGTVLLVDDEKMVLDVGERMLKKMGYSVLTAAGGREGVDLYRRKAGEIDLVILDMIMPDMGGGRAFDAIKGIDPEARVLLSSGYSLEGEAREILDRGCDGFIQKPFGLRELSTQVGKVLGVPPQV